LQSLKRDLHQEQLPSFLVLQHEENLFAGHLVSSG
jgi:hypothetical protein